MDENLEPIPSPPGHHLREFCHRLLPVLVFASAALSVGFLWHTRFVGTQLFGEVESTHADVVALNAGTLVNLAVDRFQHVTNGQLVGVIEAVDSENFLGNIAVMRSELEVMQSRMALDQARNEQNTETIHAQWLEQRVGLATARVNLQNALRELERAKTLHREKIVSDAELDLAQNVADALDAEVRERSVVVERLAGSVERLTSANQVDRGGGTNVILASLAAQDSRLQLQRIQKLRAPIEGVVRSIHHRAGERIAAGTVILEIVAPHSSRIIGYVHQPITMEPHPDMPVEIRTRGLRRQIAHSRIMSVGADLELVNAPLRLRSSDNSMVERGLPFSVELPPNLEVYPGELVDLIVRR